MGLESRVTVKDVAKMAGVSPGTVSNALSGKRPVSEATRQRVLEVIEELGYRPNLLARGLVNRQTATLAVVAAGLEYFGPSRTLVGIEETATELGYTLLLDLLHLPYDDEEAVEAILDSLTSHRVDGIIWAVHEIDENRNWIDEARLRQLPPVVFLTMGERSGLSILTTDNRDGATLAVEHLIEQGRRTIGIVTGPLDWWEARERLDAWRSVLEAHKIEPVDSLIFHGNWSAASGEQSLAPLLSANAGLDAIFACNDQMALGVLRAAHIQEIDIPEHLAVVGYDNIPEAAYFCPSLTSVRQNLKALGREAVTTLHAMIEAGATGGPSHAPTMQLIAPELIIRESSVKTA